MLLEIKLKKSGLLRLIDELLLVLGLGLSKLIIREAYGFRV